MINNAQLCDMTFQRSHLSLDLADLTDLPNDKLYLDILSTAKIRFVNMQMESKEINSNSDMLEISENVFQLKIQQSCYSRSRPSTFSP